MIALIVPVFRETATVAQSVNHFASLARRWNLSLLIVGTARERSTEGINPTLLAARNAAQSMAFPYAEILEAPSLESNRAHQVNYAVGQTAGSSIRIMTFDVDSRVSTSCLNNIMANIGHELIHTPALFLDNFDHLSIIQKGQALYQSRWTIAHECKRIWLNAGTGLVNYHLVGHGLCIAKSLLARAGMFSEKFILEDVHLGYRLGVLGSSAVIVPDFELADSPQTFMEGWRQQIRWSAGVQQYPLYCFDFLREFPNVSIWIKLRAIVYGAQGLLSSLTWNISSYVFAISLVFAICGEILAICFLGIYFAELLLCSVLFWRRGYIRWRDLLGSPLYLSLELLKRSFPANEALILSLLHRRAELRKADHHEN
jgi:hypothetical protein